MYEVYYKVSHVRVRCRSYRMQVIIDSRRLPFRNRSFRPKEHRFTENNTRVSEKSVNRLARMRRRDLRKRVFEANIVDT